MRLVNADLGLDIDLKEGIATNLVIENPMVMTEVVEGLIQAYEGNSSEFVLSDNLIELSIGKNAELITDVFHIEFNDRKILTKLYLELAETGQTFSSQIKTINSEILSFLEDAISHTSYDLLSYELELDISKLLKIYDVKIKPEYGTLAEKIIEYSKLVRQLLKKNILIVLNLREFLTAEEVNDVLQMICYQHMYVLLIDHKEYTFKEGERVYIIDNDKCIIDINSPNLGTN